MSIHRRPQDRRCPVTALDLKPGDVFRHDGHACTVAAVWCDLYAVHVSYWYMWERWQAYGLAALAYDEVVTV